MENKEVEVKNISEEKECKTNVVEDYYEAESRQFSGCWD